MKKIIIAAVAENGAIGKDNALLWHISADMKYFRKTTMGCPVIMGYRTWISIGRPLPGRKNIVITKKPFDAPEGVVTAANISEAFAAVDSAYSSPEGESTPETSTYAIPDKCFIIGGAKTYERTIDIADSLYITLVKTNISDADAFFPEINPEKWKKVSETPPETDPGSGLSYSFIIYDRI